MFLILKLFCARNHQFYLIVVIIIIIFVEGNNFQRQNVYTFTETVWKVSGIFADSRYGCLFQTTTLFPVAIQS